MAAENDVPGGMHRFAAGKGGQSTVEYALVLLAFVSMLVTFGLLWHAVRDGRLLHLAGEASSHSFSGGVDAQAFQDIALY